MKTNIEIVEKDKGNVLAVAGGNYRIIIGGNQTDNAYAVVEMIVPPGGGPPPHAHRLTQEMFYVLEGEVEFKTEAGKSIVAAGGFVNIPLGGAIHCFKNVSGTVARLLCTVVPAGLEKIFEAIGVPVKPGEFLPRPALTDELKKLMTELNTLYQQEIYPMDYLD